MPSGRFSLFFFFENIGGTFSVRLCFHPVRLHDTHHAGGGLNMKSDQKALCKRAADLERNEQKKFQNNLAAMSVLEPLLLDVYATIHPKPREYELRKLLVHAFNAMVKDIFGNSNGFPIIEPFGSFTMDLFTGMSDLDLSLNFSDDKALNLPRERKISFLKKFAHALYSFQNKGHVSGVLPIMGARVPIVKVVDCGTGIECDISVENKDGISRSSIFAVVSSIDERFRILSYLMKFWAKVHDINSSKDHTMNSLTIISLVAFHLQTRDPPILPPFSTLFKDGTDIASVQNVAFGLKSFGRKNVESVAGLFVSLLNKLSAVESLWQHGLCASIYEGSWIYKKWKSRVGHMSVEDYLDRSENFARAVGKDEIQKIYICIRDSCDNLSSFMYGRLDAFMLKKSLFGSIPMQKPLNQLTNEDKDVKRKYPLDGPAAPPFEDTFTKRKRYTEADGEHPGLNEPINNTSFHHLPIPQQMPAASSQYTQRMRHLEPPVKPINNIPLHHLSVPQQMPAASSQYAQRMHHLEPPVNPSLWASQIGYQAESHSHHPFNQLSYESGNLSLPLVLNQLHYYGSMHHRPDQHLTLHGPWDSRPTIPLPGYYDQDIRHSF